MHSGPVFLNEKIWFPPPEAADEDGLLAVGGDLSAERLLLAYKNEMCLKHLNHKSKLFPHQQK
jgi:hypothetical protein